MAVSLVLLFCSPCTGKTVHCLEKYSGYKRVCLADVFEENPSLNLRQVVTKYVIKFLNEGNSVIVDDCNEKASKRKSYVNLVMKKLSDINIECLILKPYGGIEQSLWSREMLIAESLALKKECTKDWGKMDCIIRGWEDVAERPVEEDKLCVKEYSTQLVIQTAYKFEIPALFIQWESLYKEAKEGGLYLVKGVTEAINKWYTCNKCGRVIIVHGGTNIPGVTSSEKDSQIRFILKELASKLPDCPVYLLYLHQPLSAGSYCIPPQPGMIAFLHRLHNINLHGKTTMYWYHNATHMKVAEKAGVKHIKASRMFSHPNSASSSQATVRPSIPSMLNDCNIVAPLTGYTDLYNTDAMIPLYSLSLTSKSGIVCKKMASCGRTLYMAYKNQDMLDKYSQLYCDNATKINSSEDSKIQQLCIQSTPSHGSLSQKGSINVSMSVDRGLPSWMMPTKKKKSTHSLKRNESSSLEAEPVKKKTKQSRLKSVGSSTVYILSDEELLESSKLILEQAGEKVPTEEEVEEFISQHGSLLSKSQTGSTTITLSTTCRSKHTVDSSDSNEEQNEIEKSTKSYNKTKKKTSEAVKHQEEVQVSSMKKSRLSEEFSEQTVRELDDFFSDSDEEPKRKAPPSRKKDAVDSDLEKIFYSTKMSPTHKKSPDSYHESQIRNSIKHGETALKPSPVFHGKIADANDAQFDMFLNSLIDSADDDMNSSSKFAVPLSSRSNLDNTVILHSSSIVVPDSSSGKSGSSHNSSGQFIPDSLVPNSVSDSRNSSRTASSKDSVFTVPDSLVKGSSSFSSKSSKSPKSSMTLPESLVRDSTSLSSKSSKSPKSSMTLPESLVRDSTSFSSKSSKSPKSSMTLPESLVKDSSSLSNKSSRSLKSSVTLPESLVKDTSSYSSKLSGGLSSEVIGNSLVSDSSKSSHKSTASSGQVLQDSFVPDTINSVRESSSLSSSNENKKVISKRSDVDASATIDPFLDDFI